MKKEFFQLFCCTVRYYVRSVVVREDQGGQRVTCLARGNKAQECRALRAVGKYSFNKVVADWTIAAGRKVKDQGGQRVTCLARGNKAQECRALRAVGKYSFNKVVADWTIAAGRKVKDQGGQRVTCLTGDMEGMGTPEHSELRTIFAQQDQC